VGITLQAGNVCAGTACTTNNPPATNVAVVANIGKVIVGQVNPTNPRSTRPCVDTSIEKHMGTDRPGDDRAAVRLGALQRHTTFKATTTRRTFSPVCLARTEVGPFAA
jgi:hypothetical protein